MPEKNLIEIEGLSFKRGDRVIFDGLDMVVRDGACWPDHGDYGSQRHG
jgi:ABC-type transporter Mla maintaining outer membrane lipid asymmetry ATPase subunit MlaF